MEKSLMTSSGKSTRVNTRLRNATFLVQNSKNRPLGNKNHAINHKNNRNSASNKSISVRNSANVRIVNNINRNASNQDNNNGNTSMVSNANSVYKGKFGREVYSAICLRLGPTSHIPADSVQALFNDMQLYPSKTQVSEMLQIARQCGNRNGGPQILTFGEFCVFLREMQKSKQPRKSQQSAKQSNKCTSNCEVFLGGSCNPTTWRTDTAIPELKRQGITFYNPQVSMWAPELVAQEHDAKQAASVLLYVVDSQTRSTGGMIEVAYLVAAGRCVVLVAQPYQPGQSIMGETITQREWLDLVEAQTALLMLVKSRGIKVHDNLKSALQCTANLLRNSSAANGMSAEEQVTHKLKKLREAFDSYDTNKTGQLCFKSVLDAYYKLTNRSLTISDLYSYLSASKTSDPSKLKISFEQFCALVAEFSSEGCDANTPDEWATQPLQRQCSMNNNTADDALNTSPADCALELTPVNTTSSTTASSELTDVYLGGSIETNSTWREDIAIPLVKKHGLTYYNPTLRETNVPQGQNCIFDNLANESICVSNGDTELSQEHYRRLEKFVLSWKRTMDNSKVLLFVITNDTRSLTTMVMAAHYIGLGKDVVLCIQQLPVEDLEICNEKLTKQAIKDYNRGRIYLTDFAKRKQIPVFENITEAVMCAVTICQRS